MKRVFLILVALAAGGCVTFEPPTASDEPTGPVGSATAPPSTTSAPSGTPVPTASPTALPTLLPTASPSASPEPSAVPTPTPTPPIISTKGACDDDAYTLNGDHWDEPFQYYVSVKSLPPNLTLNEVRAVVQRSFDNITQARNDCGLPDRVSAEAIYIGTTSEVPCELSNEHNVVGFGKVPRYLGRDAIAYVCPFHDTDGEIFAADIVLNIKIGWAISEEMCKGSDELLEPTLTHEVGHVFGLGHVGERNHGDLTMSTRSNGACDDEESTLGLGDILALEELY